VTALRLYFRYAAISIRGQMEYRASFLMQTAGQFAVTGIEFLGVWALFDRFGAIKGWDLYEVALFYGLISVTFAISDAITRGFDVFGATVKAGDFDRLLVRPRSPILQLLGHELTLRRLGRLLQGMTVLVIATSGLDLTWSADRLVLLGVAVTCGVCLFVGLMLLQATSAFWTIESLEVWNAFTYGGVTMSQYPVSIYRPWFRQFFTVVIPLACVTYYPGLAILKRPDLLGAPPATGWIAPLVGPLFLLGCIGVWRVGMRHYQSTGS
jgi:ABC-2 type transport system permease protein